MPSPESDPLWIHHQGTATHSLCPQMMTDDGDISLPKLRYGNNFGNSSNSISDPKMVTGDGDGSIFKLQYGNNFDGQILGGDQIFVRQIYTKYRNREKEKSKNLFGPKGEWCAASGSNSGVNRNKKEGEVIHVMQEEKNVIKCIAPVLASQRVNYQPINSEQFGAFDEGMDTLPHRRLRVLRDYSHPPYVEQIYSPPFLGQRHLALKTDFHTPVSTHTYFPVWGFFVVMAGGFWLLFGSRKKRPRTVDRRKESVVQVWIPKGFPNLGKTCYISVTFQCYLSLDSLRRELQCVGPLGRTTQALRKVLYGPANDVTPFIEALQMTRKPIDTRKTGSPVDIFCEVMFKVIGEESPSIAELFGGFRETTKTFNCSHSCPPKQKRFEHIYLNDLPGRNDPITNAFVGLFSFESPPFEGDCPKCKCKEVCTVKWKIVRPPIVLVLEVLFKNPIRENSVKFQNVMMVPNTAFLARDTGDAENVKYQLQGVIVQTGAGKWTHFVAFVRRVVEGHERWFSTNDNVVRETSLAKVLKEKQPAYLVYELI